MSIRSLFVSIAIACLAAACGGGGTSQSGAGPTPPPAPPPAPPPEGGGTYLPHADAGQSRVVDLGQVVTLDGSASTVGAGRTISYNWSISKTPAGSNAALTGATLARPTFVPDLDGDYVVALLVGDGVSPNSVATVTLQALWRPAEGRMPATGNAVYLESDNGDPVASGASYAYTHADAILAITSQGPPLNLSVEGNETWWGSFAAPGAATRLVPGYYGGMQSEPWTDAGGVSWWGNLGACEDASATWLVIDSVSYDGDTLTAIDLRFGQRCQGSSGMLHGRVRWTNADTTQPPGPATPPAGLWQPTDGATPPSGNYVYLQSAAGDVIGQGQTLLFTEADGTLAMTAEGSHVNVDLQAATWWVGNFAGMNSLDRVTPGYYGNLEGYPFHNPVRGGLDWSGDGRSCAATGWFVVDNVTYVADALVALDLRFEQHCGDATAPALNGQIHWVAPVQ